MLIQRLSLACIFLGSMLFTRPTAAQIRLKIASDIPVISLQSKTGIARKNPGTPTESITVTLRSDTLTHLGDTTKITATLTPSEALSNWSFVTTTVDSEGSVGGFPSLAIGYDGLPIISHTDFSLRGLKIAKCLTADCAQVISKTVDISGSTNTAYNTSIAVSQDGLPIVSYWTSDGGFRAAKCQTISCTSVTVTPLDVVSPIGADTSITIGSDGLPIISYYQGMYTGLKVVKCQTVSCTTYFTTTVDTAPPVGLYPSIAIGSDGFPIMSYFDTQNADLKVAKCLSLNCDSFTNIVVDGVGDVGFFSSLKIGKDGLPIISYYNYSTEMLKVAVCQTLNCSSVVSTSLESQLGVYSSLAIGVDGLPLISSVNNLSANLYLTKCRTSSCSAFESQKIDSTGNNAGRTSLAIDSDGLPVIGYQDTSYLDLKVAKALPAVTYTLDYGDGTPMVSGAWGQLSILPFTHIYSTTGTFTVVITATGSSVAATKQVITVTPSTFVPTPIHVTLKSDNPTLLSQFTSFTATFSSDNETTHFTDTLYVLNFGDHTPNITGTWETSSTISFTHTFSVMGSYTTTITMTNGISTVQDMAMVSVVANSELSGSLTHLDEGQLITYTFTVTNSNSTLPAVNVILSGSVPANASLVETQNAMTFTAGGDYGKGYAQSQAGVTLQPGQSTQIRWVVEVSAPMEDVITRAHATSTSTIFVINVIDPISRLKAYVPTLLRSTTNARSRMH